MAQKDLAGKILLGIDEIFCDVVNILLLKGERLIKEEDLEDVNTHTQYHADGQYHEMIRDVAKYWKKQNVCIAVIGVEHESKPDRMMPLRVFSYDGGAYRAQITEKQEEKNKKEDKSKTEPKRIFPVITLVLNFNTETRWNTAKSLLEIVDAPDFLKPLINDYKVNVIDVAFLDRSKVDSFKSDFWYVADYFWQIRNNGYYSASEKEMKYAFQIMQMLSAMTGDKRFEQAYNEKQREGGGNKMCEYLDLLESRGEKRGEKIGEQKGIDATFIVISMLNEGETDIKKLAEKANVSQKTVKIIVNKYRKL